LIARLRLFVRLARALSRLNTDGLMMVVEMVQITGSASMFRKGALQPDADA
jgi:hypothetical protein